MSPDMLAVEGVIPLEDDNKLSYFFLGLGLGVAVGALFAPNELGAVFRKNFSGSAAFGPLPIDNVPGMLPGDPAPFAMAGFATELASTSTE